jgi:uncharacterized protein (DUF433 family)
MNAYAVYEKWEKVDQGSSAIGEKGKRHRRGYGSAVLGELLDSEGTLMVPDGYIGIRGPISIRRSAKAGWLDVRPKGVGPMEFGDSSGEHCSVPVNYFRQQLEGVRGFVVADKTIMSGVPVVRGTRVPVSFIIDCFAAGFSLQEIVEEYPGLTAERVEKALLFASNVLDIELD